jgi:hypothetical protein
MTATIILSPAKAAETICHEEQLRIWADDHIIGALAMEGYFRDDLSYDDKIDIERIVMREIKSIVESAFDHPAAVTIRRS